MPTTFPIIDGHNDVLSRLRRLSVPTDAQRRCQMPPGMTPPAEASSSAASKAAVRLSQACDTRQVHVEVVLALDTFSAGRVRGTRREQFGHRGEIGFEACRRDQLQQTHRHVAGVSVISGPLRGHDGWLASNLVDTTR